MRLFVGREITKYTVMYSVCVYRSGWPPSDICCPSKMLQMCMPPSRVHLFLFNHYPHFTPMYCQTHSHAQTHTKTHSHPPTHAQPPTPNPLHPHYSVMHACKQYAYTHTHTHPLTRMHANANTHTYTLAHTPAHTHTYTHTHSFTHTHTNEAHT